jgi:hypothetical protein
MAGISGKSFERSNVVIRYLHGQHIGVDQRYIVGDIE